MADTGMKAHLEGGKRDYCSFDLLPSLVFIPIHVRTSGAVTAHDMTGTETGNGNRDSTAYCILKRRRHGGHHHRSWTLSSQPRERIHRHGHRRVRSNSESEKITRGSVIIGTGACTGTGTRHEHAENKDGGE